MSFPRNTSRTRRLPVLQLSLTARGRDRRSAGNKNGRIIEEVLKNYTMRHTNKILYYIIHCGVCQGWRYFLRARAQIFCKFRRKNISRALGNIVDENKILESSIIIIKYCTIINTL